MAALRFPRLHHFSSNGNGISRDQIQCMLPENYTDLEKAIARVLLESVCIAYWDETRPSNDGHVGRTINDTCRICLEPLAQTLNISHVYPGVSGHTRIALLGSPLRRDSSLSDSLHSSETTDQTISPGKLQNKPTLQEPCHCAYHFTCMVEWARANLVQQQPVTCPMDRQRLIPQDKAAQLTDSFHLHATPEHPIRMIINVIPFWNLLYPEGNYQPKATFQVGYIPPMVILRMASMGCDVGIISANLVGLFNLDQESQEQYHMYLTPRIHAADSNSVRASQPLYRNFIFLEFKRELVESHQHVESSYIFVPITQAGGSIFRRYLLGLMGSVYYIQSTNKGIFPHQIRLSNDEIISLHAEMRIRRMMNDDIQRYGSPSIAVSYYPYVNEVRNITEGHYFDDRNDPAHSYRFDDINIGQSNDEIFARLVMTSPEALVASDELVFNYRRHLTVNNRRIKEQSQTLNPFYQVNYPPQPNSSHDQDSHGASPEVRHLDVEIPDPFEGFAEQV